VLKKFVIATAIAAVMGAAGLMVGDAEAQTPRRGGTIRFTAPYGSSFASLDIHTTNRSQDEIWARAIHRTLYSWDATNNKPVLELAREVSVSADGLVYTYKLRDDAYFHNGRRMTADDIIWSFTRLMDGAKAFPGARYVRMIKGAVDVEKGQAKEISGLRKIDDFTLEMTLTEKLDPGFSFYQSFTAIYPVGEGNSEAFLQRPIGLGPYKFAEYVPGSRIVAERWEKFYKPGRPYADRVVISIMGEAAARDVAFRSREIDASILGATQYVAYRADPQLSKGLLEVPEVFTRAIGLNLTYKPFTDRRVRQAIAYAIDADLIIKRLLREKAFRATSWLPISSPAYDSNTRPYPYDPAKAKQLLAEAGYPNGIEFEITATANESWGIPVVEAIIPMLQRAGIKATIKPVESTVLAENLRSGQFQAFMYSMVSGPDPATALRCYHSATPQSACNYPLFKNAEFDKLLDEAGRTDDPAKRTDLLRRANGILFEELPMWWFNYNKAVMAYQPWIHGLQPNATELAVQFFEDIWVDETSPAK
jgi:peptide/nickel transport system substrate-binding protein